MLEAAVIGCVCNKLTHSTSAIVDPLQLELYWVLVTPPIVLYLTSVAHFQLLL